jgi:rfaE bifunctional protein nucleotidyltransferase chain/domain
VTQQDIISSDRDSGTKVLSLEAASARVAELRANGVKVAMAHGVFDLLHIGHVRHLQEARSKGDFLVVSITADAYVNKGPGRPVFPAPLRAEMLGNLGVVDIVVVNDAPTAVPALRAIKPNVYVKGLEYANAEDDVTGKIVDERNAVEESGGELVFTDDIVYSSSTLINQYLDVYDPALKEYLDGCRARELLPQLLNAIERISDMRVLVVGDAIIDEYQYVIPMGKSLKETIIATRFTDREEFAGGVFATANHVASFCNNVEVITCLGDQDSHLDFIRHSLKPGIKLNHVMRSDAPTTKKCRFVEQNYFRKMFEVYTFEDKPLSSEQQAQFDALVAKRAPEFDLVIVNDFGHGLIAPSTIKVLREKSKFLAVNAQCNSANYGFNLVTRYRQPDYLCIDAPEARLAVSEKDGDVEALIRDKLAPRTECRRLVVTHGKHGCITFDQQQGVNHIPAFTKTVVDTVGAGDAFLAVTSPLVALGLPLDMVGFVGNAVGAIKVGIVGHRRSIEKSQLVKSMTALLK